MSHIVGVNYSSVETLTTRNSWLCRICLWLLLRPYPSDLYCSKAVSVPISCERRCLTQSSAITGFVRSYGKHLPEEGISLNAVSPNVVRTAISTGDFYDQLEKDGLLTPMEGVIEAFESFLGASDMSGEILEVGPNGGFVRRSPAHYLDEKSQNLCDLLHERGRPLHAQKT